MSSKILQATLLATIFAATGSAVLAQDAIRIGAPLPLTGPLSPEGLKQQRGYDLWAETTNASGGITAGGKTYDVEIVYVDYASNTPRAVQTAERLITEEEVNFLFAPFGSGAAKAPQDVCFVSANTWDAQAAANFGFQVARINRFGLADENIPGRPKRLLDTLNELPAALAKKN